MTMHVKKESKIEVEPVSLNEWRDAAFSNAKEKGWHDTDNDDFVAKLALIHSEISEVLEEYRNNKGVTEIYYNGEKPEGIPVELADALIRIFDLCGKYGIDIQEAVKIKHNYNKTRPHRHGGKKI